MNAYSLPGLNYPGPLQAESFLSNAVSHCLTPNLRGGA